MLFPQSGHQRTYLLFWRAGVDNAFAFGFRSEGLKDLRRRCFQAHLLQSQRQIIEGDDADFFFIGFVDAADGHIPRSVQFFDGSQQTGHLRLDDLITVFQLAAHRNSVAGDLTVFHISNLRNAQSFRDLRTNLSSIAIDGLPSGKDQIKVAKISNGGGNGVGSGPGICADKLPAADQHGVVCAHGQTFAQHIVGLGRTHGRRR